MLNKVQLIGNVGQEPNISQTQSGKKYSRFTLATQKRYKNANGEIKTDTTWHNILVWEKLAEIVEKYVKKGSKIYCEGEIKYSEFEKDGVKKTFTNIVINELKMLDSKPTQKTETKVKNDNKPVSEESEENENDNLPF